MELRDAIRRILKENLPSVGQNAPIDGAFPYDPSGMNQPQQIDPLTDYVLDWNRFSTNNEVFDFPKDEFNLGMSVERNKDAEAQILDLADKVIDTLKKDPQFYSNLTRRRM